MLGDRKAQSTIEYAVMAAVVVAALLLMQRYMQRGVAGKLRTATDQIGEQFTPLHYTAKYGTFSKGTRKETADAKGGTTSKITDIPEVQGRRGFGGGEDSTGDEHITQGLETEALFSQ